MLSTIAMFFKACFRTIGCGTATFLAFMLLYHPVVPWRSTLAEFYWVYFFERTGVFYWWPLFFAVLALGFSGRGLYAYWRTGTLPALASLKSTAAVFGVGVAWLGFGYCASYLAKDRSAAWCWFALIPLAIMAVSTTFGVVAYMELWRRFFNRSVVSSLKRQLSNGVFSVACRQRAQKVEVDPPSTIWGSPHCLRVVQGDYEIAKMQVDAAVRARREPPLAEFQRAGQTLVDYLSLRWGERHVANDSVPTEAQCNVIAAHAIREMLTVTLWASNGKDYGRLDAWTNKLSRVFGDRPSWPLLECLVRLDRRLSEPTELAIFERDFDAQAAFERDVIAHFRNVKTHESVDCSGRDAREVCAACWLLLSRKLPLSLRESVWLEMREGENKGRVDFKTIDKPADDRVHWSRWMLASVCSKCGQQAAHEGPCDLCQGTVLECRTPDLSSTLAQFEIGRLYEMWSAITPEGFSVGLNGRSRYANQLLTNEPRRINSIRDAVERDTRDISSCVYREVYRSAKVIGLHIALILLIIGLGALAISRANPRFPYIAGPNINEHVESVSAAVAYRQAAPYRALSSGKNYLVIAGEGGAMAYDKRSRVARRLQSQGSWDVASVGARDEFLLLNENQGVDFVRHFLPMSSQSPWIPAPAAPVWKGLSVSDVTPLASEFDGSNWFVAVPKGLAVYPMEPLAEGEEGAIWRHRSWNPIDLGGGSIVHAVFTDEGLWLGIDEEPHGRLAFVDRKTMKRVPERDRKTEKLVTLDANRAGEWATAFDRLGGMHLHSLRLPGCVGPFLGRDFDEKTQLSSLSDVNFAELTPDVVWIGASNAIFAYPFDQRRLIPIGSKSKAVGLFPLGVEQRNRVVAIDSGGVYLVDKSSSLGQFHQRALDQMEPTERITSAGVSQGGSVCLYLLETPEGTECRLTNVADGARSHVVIPRNSWGRHPTKFHTFAWRNNQNLVVTDQGSFKYDAVAHSYLDNSKGTFVNDAGESVTKELDSFLRPVVGTDRVLAISPTHGPAILSSQQDSEWRLPDPQNKTSPIMLADTDSAGFPAAFGIDGNGGLHRYESTLQGFDVSSFSVGKAPSLISSTANSNRFKGDLQLNDDGWRVGFLHAGKLITYEARSGTIAEASLELNNRRITQLRICGAGHIALSSDRQIIEPLSGETLFGRGTATFDPLAATTIASGDDQEVLLGGPDGRVLAYSFSRGTFDHMGSEPVSPDARIVELQHVPTGTLARASDDSIYFLLASSEVQHDSLLSLEGEKNAADDGSVFNAIGRAIAKAFGFGSDTDGSLPNDTEQPEKNRKPAETSEIGSERETTIARGEVSEEPAWTRLNGVSRWAHRDGVTWLSGREGLALTSTKSLAAATDIEFNFASGSDARDVVSRAVFVWQSSQDTVAVFTASSTIGVYDIENDVFRKIETGLKTPSQFAQGLAGVAILDGSSVHFFDRAGNLKRLGELPTSAASLAVDNLGSVHVAFVDDGTAHVWTWDPSQADNALSKNKLGGPGPGIDLRAVKWAAVDTKYATLVDHRGGCARYDMQTGNWVRLRESQAGKRLVKWIQAGESTDLLFSSENGRSTEVLRVGGASGSVTAGGTWQIAPDKLVDYLGEMALDCEQHARQSLVFAEVWSAESRKLQELAKHFRGARTAFPKDVRTDQFQITWNDQGVTFRVWGIDQRPNAGGFPLDQFDGIVLDEQGVAWGLKGGQLRRYVIGNSMIPTDDVRDVSASQISRLPNGQFLVRDSSNADQFYSLESGNMMIAPASRRMAALALGQLQLTWVWHSPGRISTQWQRGDEALPVTVAPVWGSRDGRFASQCVTDIALEEGNVLLVATELGLIVRDATSFRARDVDLNLKTVKMLRTEGPAPNTWVFHNGQFRRYWFQGRLQPLSAQDRVPVNKVTDGFWKWAMTYSSPVSSQLEIANASQPQRLRRTESDSFGWRFADDTLNWIARSPFETPCWLATQDGVWQFDRKIGRLSREPRLGGDAVRRIRSSLDAKRWTWQDEAGSWHRFEWESDIAPPSFSAGRGEFAVQNAAMHCVYQDGELTMTALDDEGRSVFQNGKFFFDSPNEIIGIQDRLYLMVNGRCLLRRSVLDPRQILEFWPLPEGLSATGYRLAQHEGNVRLESTNPEDSAWLLTADGLAGWREVDRIAWRLDTQVGPIAWLHSSDGRSVPRVLTDAKSFYSTAEPPGKEIPKHWSLGRFAWDQISSCTMLGSEWAILATHAGTVALDVRDPTKSPIAQLWPGEVDAVETARRNGKVVGVVAQDGETENLLKAENRAELLRLTVNPRETYRSRSVLTFDYGSSDNTAEQLTVSQEWQSLDGNENAVPVRIGSGLEPVIRGDLVENGQFVFDRAQLVCTLGTDSSRWLTISDTDSAGSLVGLHEFQAVEQGKFVLRRLWHTDSMPRYLRYGGGKTIYGAFFDQGRRLELKQLTLDERVTELTWRDAPVGTADPLFQAGWQQLIDVGKLQWSRGTPYYVWDRDRGIPKWKLTPDDYPLFVDEDHGIALPFDLFRTISVNEDQSNIAIGTRGGIIRCPFVAGDGRDSLASGSTQLVVEPREVERVRFGPLDTLFVTAKSGEANVTLHLDAANVEATEVEELKQLRYMHGAVPSLQVEASRSRKQLRNVIDGIPARSDDASLFPFDWLRQYVGDRTYPIKGIVDVTPDKDGGREVLWVLADDGIFRLFTDIP